MLRDTLKIAVKALKRNKIRTFLSVLGVVIGISVVIIVVSAGEGIKSFVVGQLEVFGTDFIQIEVKVPNVSQTSAQNVAGMATGITITTLSQEDADAIKKISNIENIYAGQITQELISRKGEIKKTLIMGVNSSYIDIDKAQVEEGRFFTEEEEAGLARVVVLGKDIKEKFFGFEDPIGKNIKINRVNYKVIGVIEERGSAMFFNWDDILIMPLKTLQKSVMGIDHVAYMVATYHNQAQAEDTAEEIRFLLRQRHDIPFNDPNKDDFGVVTMQEAREMIEKVLGGITLLLVAIVGISLLVGGIGITNVMYVAVTERTYEIGLRKSVGASRKDILNQFLTEAVVITFLGGIIGVILGIGISYIIYQIASLKGFDWSFVISLRAIFGSFVFSVVLGLIFGMYPARRAASFKPIEAIRYE